MGKRGRHKDRLYIKASEYSDGLGGKKVASSEGPRFLKLPFNHCALSFVEMGKPTFTDDGWCYEKENILKHIDKFGTHPHTGNPLSITQLYDLKLQKGESGNYECPITQKEFNDSSHVVANRKSGFAYSHDAVKEMIIKANSWIDLVDGTPLTRDDLITLQDPAHIKNAAEKVTPKVSKQKKEKKEKRKRPEPEPIQKQPMWTSHPDGVPDHGGLTCSAAPSGQSKRKSDVLDKVLEASQQQNLSAELKLVTTLGPLTLELYCKNAPRTVYNFVKLSNSSYYNSTIFHRVIKGFMVQGGDPSGTGSGGRSFFGRDFPDEIIGNKLRHTRGAISMANSGANSNGSQFFIVFGKASHLDGKHTVFGRVVSGDETLTKIENVATTSDERPTTDIIITSLTVTKDPFANLEQSFDPEAVAKREAEAAALKKAGSEIRPWFSAPQPVLDKAGDTEVGKYLKAPSATKTTTTNSTPITKKPKTWNFSSW
eukprot:TRINITY_DN31474_c0_g1_i1.p1 TRINITY_DN31474_c0_g1~~TRINITY_DN31474_c0_g1_i1.p1  ORF type:complete len:501 (+),score=96.65 TRINITY_DN31474_c0_g1_i1:55-1503(+)